MRWAIAIKSELRMPCRRRRSGLGHRPEMSRNRSLILPLRHEQLPIGSWRRRGDSNPRYGFWAVQRFSKPPPSASRPRLPHGAFKPFRPLTRALKAGIQTGRAHAGCPPSLGMTLMASGKADHGLADPRREISFRAETAHTGIPARECRVETNLGERVLNAKDRLADFCPFFRALSEKPRWHVSCSLSVMPRTGGANN